MVWNVNTIKDPGAMSHCCTDNYEGELDLLQIFEAISVNDPDKIEFEFSEGYQIPLGRGARFRQ
ncbi:hypothetical protein GPL21_34700 [Bradyrhizobium pachyrhizi]|uniref:Uncharacterized protein n=1 Tax=Bradyrhizobium pachyrhizi TaxID=280333 RepID=A0A844T2B9_9BRAD|nr:hypothetical protein [Bradyrhizobium pachyrhizi]MVT70234.1 hypothetical protein [Bradyrhizobium pachyrhizi]